MNKSKKTKLKNTINRAEKPELENEFLQWVRENPNDG